MPDKRSRNTLSKEQCDKFHEYMLYWQGVLSLGDWRIERGSKGASPGAMADVTFDEEARMVTYRLGDWKGTEINDSTLKETALHEMLHVLLHDPLTVAQDRTAAEGQVGVAEHRVINVLERLLMKGGL